uniref:Uncharacterized protein n=1 Tax=Mola mola TaxID=94237 RepID=A0A3Q3VV96_MOLML
MSELSDEASESEQLGASLSLWLGDSLVRPEELDVPLDLHTACSIGQYDVVAECIKKEPGSGFTPLMEAATSGHEIIVQYLLDHVSSGNLQTVLQSLRRLSATEKVSVSWEQP